jgi:trk system potassium uptake protein
VTSCFCLAAGGGIKMIRRLVIARQAANQTKQLMHPRAILPLRIGGRAMPDSFAVAPL